MLRDLSTPKEMINDDNETSTAVGINQIDRELCLINIQEQLQESNSVVNISFKQYSNTDILTTLPLTHKIISEQIQSMIFQNFVPNLSQFNLYQNLRSLTIVQACIENLLQISQLFQTNIASLDLTDNKISDCQLFSRMKNLQTLILSNNKINSVKSLQQLKLKYLDLSGNLLENSEIKSLYDQNNTLEIKFNDFQLVSQTSASSQQISSNLQRILHLDFVQDELDLLLHNLSATDYVQLANDTQFISKMCYNSIFLEHVKNLEYSDDLLNLFVQLQLWICVPIKVLSNLSNFKQENIPQIFQFLIQSPLQEQELSNILNNLVSLSINGFQNQYLLTRFITVFCSKLKFEELAAVFAFCYAAQIVKLADQTQVNVHLNKYGNNNVNLDELLDQTVVIIQTSQVMQSIFKYNTMPGSFLCMNTLFRAFNIHSKTNPIQTSQIFEIFTNFCLKNDQPLTYPKQIETQMNILQIKKDLEKIKPKNYLTQIEERRPLNLTDQQIFQQLDTVLSFNAKWELLSAADNIHMLDDYFKTRCEQIQTNDLLENVRHCLKNYLLAGEGQSVERAIQSIARTVSTLLQFDYKSVSITIGSMLMLNTQNICKRNGKVLQNFIYEKDYIDMVQSYPNFNKQHITADQLVSWYKSLELKPLGVSLPTTVMFFGASSCVVNAEQFSQSTIQVISDINQYRTEMLKQKENFDLIDYYNADIERLRVEQLLLQNYEQTPDDYVSQFIPVVFQYLTEQIEVSNDPIKLDGCYYLLKNLYKKACLLKNHAFLEFFYKAAQYHLGVIISQTELLLSSLLSSEETFDQIQVYNLYLNSERVQKHIIIIKYIANMLISQRLFVPNPEFTQQTILILALIQSTNELLQIKNISGKPCENVQVSRISLKVLLQEIPKLIVQLKTQQIDVFDYRPLSGGLFYQIVFQAPVAQESLQKYHVSQKISKFFLLSIILGIYKLLMPLLPFINEKLFQEFLPDIQKLLHFDLIFVQNDVKVINQLEKNAGGRPDYQKLFKPRDFQVKFALNLIINCYKKVPQKEFVSLCDEVFKQKFIVNSLIIREIDQLNAMCLLPFDLQYSADYVFGAEILNQFKNEQKNLLLLQQTVKMVTQNDLSVMSLKQIKENHPQLFTYFENIPELSDFKTVMHVDQVKSGVYMSQINQYLTAFDYQRAVALKMLQELLDERTESEAQLQLQQIDLLPKLKISLNMLAIITFAVCIVKKYPELNYFWLNFINQNNKELFIQQIYPYLKKNIKYDFGKAIDLAMEGDTKNTYQEYVLKWQ
ncbi:Sec7_domain-containing protein [Hexamita inflata]|uniref:Sec7_domain-containing protein n=1 Tax=Hexamita inflata TaxID=28002 RepID=A0ABP1ISZ3_9EUKA